MKKQKVSVKSTKTSTTKSTQGVRVINTTSNGTKTVKTNRKGGGCCGR